MYIITNITQAIKIKNVKIIKMILITIIFILNQTIFNNNI